jgi:hypothetical protein
MQIAGPQATNLIRTIQRYEPGFRYEVMAEEDAPYGGYRAADVVRLERIYWKIFNEHVCPVPGSAGGVRLSPETMALDPQTISPRGSVYGIRDPETGLILRIGQTRNTTSRAGNYRTDPRTSDLEFEPFVRTDDYGLRRGLEHRFWEIFGRPPLNINRPLDLQRNENAPEYLRRADEFLGPQQ